MGEVKDSRLSDFIDASMRANVGKLRMLGGRLRLSDSSVAVIGERVRSLRFCGVRLCIERLSEVSGGKKSGKSGGRMTFNKARCCSDGSDRNNGSSRYEDKVLGDGLECIARALSFCHLV